MPSDPLILYLKRNSLDDGPGIRTTVFFKGCPLRCAWCHNPESQSRSAELSYNRDECIDCGTCISTCPENALSRENPNFVNREKCTLCFECVDSCPSMALSKFGVPMTAEAILQTIEMDKPFFDNSGGGVTLSGGEPTLFRGLAAEILSGCRERGILSILETCGHFDLDRFEQILYPLIDTIYFDVKLIDPTLHRKYCGLDNDTILGNLRHLAGLVDGNGVELLPRVPLVPEITATESNLTAIAQILSECGLSQVALLPYNPTWTNKPAMLGKNAQIQNERFMSVEELDFCRSFFDAFELID
jgi:pyruvate formate lyase activating enzyme